MKTIISKQVVALYPGGGLLQDQYFKDIRERAFNKDRYTQKEDTGIHDVKKNVTSPTGFGSNDRGHNPGAGIGLGRDEGESKDRSLSSGYNDGGQPDDETGPGNTSTTPDPYNAADTFNELFMDLKIKGQGKDDSIQGHMKHILDGSPIVAPHKRYKVDKEM